MSRDAPDYYNVQANIWDLVRQKPVILSDDFEATKLKWIHSGYGTLVRSLDYAYSGEASAKLSTDGVKAHTSAMHRYFNLLGGKNIGAEFRFACDSTDLEYIEFWVKTYALPNYYEPAVKYNVGEAEWQYYNEKEAWTKIPDSDMIMLFSIDIWHYIELATNLEDDKYSYMRGFGRVFDLSKFNVYKISEITAAYGLILALIKSKVDTVVNVYFDEVRIIELP